VGLHRRAGIRPAADGQHELQPQTAAVARIWARPAKRSRWPRGGPPCARSPTAPICDGRF